MDDLSFLTLSFATKGSVAASLRSFSVSDLAAERSMGRYVQFYPFADLSLQSTNTEETPQRHNTCKHCCS